jgi:hypothetical protein
LGGAMALLALLVFSRAGGLGQLLPDGGQTQGNPQSEDGTLGTLPIEQAGQVVQRQSVPVTGIGTMTPTNSGFTTPAGTPPTLTPTQSGSPSNVIPRQGGATTLPAPIGDIAPVQPDLVQPDPPTVTDDPELESIPALW